MAEQAEAVAAGPGLEIAVEAIGRVNYALQQNDVPVVQRIALTNRGAEAVCDVEVMCSIERVAEPWMARVSRIEPGATYNLEEVRLQLSPGALAGQTEREVTELVVEAKAGGVQVGRAARRLEVLAFNEWAGASALPEMLAAFVMPNHPALDRVLKSASELLERSTGDGSLCGYQSRSPQRAAAIAEAVYLALRACRLGYINPPASFERGGQKIRSIEQILEAQLGTCLDLAVLLASAWEQVGLHPLVVMAEGHAFAAFWTQEECFPEPVIEDGLRVRKRAELGEIVAVEATALTGSAPVAFAEAVKLGREGLQRIEEFIFAVDVRSARRLKIRPLPLRAEAAGRGAGEAPAAAAEALPGLQNVLPEAPPLRDSEEKPATPQGRIDRWKRKLLDLSLRNRLLNFRETRLSIPLLCPDVPGLENALAEGSAFSVLPRPEIRSDEARDPRAQVQRSGEEAITAFLREELKDHRVRAALTEAELSRRMTELFRAARTSVEESGVNTLYLALGQLVWYESTESPQARHAPLILLPLQLERRSTREGFRIRQSDEAPRANVTLLEKLRVDFGIDTRPLEEMPEDASGLDVALVFRRYREAVKEIARWEIVETAHIGLFSFAKFLMWHDLQEKTADLLQNRVVRYLVERPDEPFSAEPFPDARELDRTLASCELLCPMDADSSQLVAVHSAAKGRTFVLEGPPGTGKSQTITNLVAHALGEGKRVLFVAEKLAALSVVYKRLERCGLAPFCLELHSNKASKKEVVAQLAAALGGHGAAPGNWETRCAELDRKRAELNAYVEALHSIRPSGESFYAVASRLAGMNSASESALVLERPGETTQEQLAGLRAAVEELATAARAVEDVATHPLRGIGRGEWGEALAEQVRSQLAACEVSARGLLAAAKGALDELDSGADNEDAAAGLSWGDQRWLAEMCRLLLTSPAPTDALVREAGWGELKQSLEAWIRRGRDRDALRQGLFSRYRPEVLSLDLATISAALRRGMQKPGLLRWFACRGPRRQMAEMLAGGKLPDNAQLSADVDQAIKLQAENAALAEASSDGARLFGRRWAGGEADWDGLQQVIAWVEQFRALLLQRLVAGAREAAFKEGCVRLATAESDRVTSATGTAAALKELIQAHNAHLRDRKELEKLLEVEAGTWGEPQVAEYLPRFLGVLGRWRAGLPELREWSYWRRGRAQAVAAGLQGLVADLEAAKLRPEHLRAAFERAFAQQWVRAVSDATEVLRHFNGDAQLAAIERFRSLDQKVIELTRDVLRARLAAAVPQPSGPVSAASEVGLLQRQIALKRGHLPVRKLVQKLPKLLPRIKPCFLMSPLSVAQHLDTSFPPFDVVVFDEASQIPVWDAVGAIARGAEVIVVGDSKQLPPTNFFARIEGEDEIPEDDVEELESILDECNASGLPSLGLLWHYRSKHESLIAFSNYHYYQNRLHTFPSSIAQAPELGISFRRLPDARYDRAGSRTNRGEAEAIVAEIAARLTGEGDERTKGSIGVVTFNAAQQTLIEDLLDEKRRELPEIERYFTEGEEPVFVKNLENVQGDERETILFSICYGPDENGRILMNFGPLGHEGGERRLNVAITRARSQVIVFSSIRAEQIELSRTRSVGVRHLKSFLDYAERGPQAIAEATTLNAPGRIEQGLEQAIGQALAERGWEVEYQVGCSGYRIDLAVRDPERPGEYLLGIECDGPFYFSGKTVRDRDRLRQQVLESLGWRLHRAWSIDWRLNQARSLQRIEQAIQGAQRNRARRGGLRPRADVSGADQSAEVEPPRPVVLTTAATTLPPAASTYQVFEAEPLGTAEEFYSPAATRRLASTLRQIVSKESPVIFRVAARRLAGLWGLERLTSRVEARVAEVLASDTAKSRPVLDGEILWAAEHKPEEYRGFRVPGEGVAREIDEIPQLEIANAAAAVLAQQISLPRGDLTRETARLLGFARVTPKVQSTIEAAIDHLGRTPRAGVEFSADGVVSLR